MQGQRQAGSQLLSRGHGDALSGEVGAAQTFPGGWKSQRTRSSDETLPAAGAAFQLHGSFEG